MTHSKTTCDGTWEVGAKSDQCQQGQECRQQVAISDHRPEFHWHAGADRARSQDRPPTIRNAWTHSSGAKASSRGSPDRRGATYQNAMSEYATKLNVN
jgi:hypothetical protein